MEERRLTQLRTLVFKEELRVESPGDFILPSVYPNQSAEVINSEMPIGAGGKPPKNNGKKSVSLLFPAQRLGDL